MNEKTDQQTDKKPQTNHPTKTIQHADTHNPNQATKKPKTKQNPIILRK